MLLLVNPPVAKPCEPPSGLSHLAGALRAHGIQYQLVDANLEGILYLLKRPVEARDVWTRRAAKHIDANLESLRHSGLYGTFDKYKRTVLEVNRLLGQAAVSDVRVSLEDYEHNVLSPVKTDDLLYAARHPEENPFYPYFSGRFQGIIEKQQPCLVGFSLSYLSQALCVFAMMGFVKKHFPDIRIVLGGSLLTSWMKKPGWENSFSEIVDRLVCGPGEGPLLALVDRKVLQKQCFKPVYDFDNRSGQYLAPGLIMPYSASSGCYWGKCAFCPERAEGNAYIQRPPQTIVSELQDLVKEWKPVIVHLTDNAISPAVLKHLAKNPPGAPWYGFVRLTGHHADPDRSEERRGGKECSEPCINTWSPYK
jgi:hypothetical protein